MISTNQENLLKYLDDDIEENSTMSIKEEEYMDPVNHYHGHDHLQDHLVITGIPLIAIDSKEEVGKCEENEDSAGGSSLAASCDLFLRISHVW